MSAHVIERVVRRNSSPDGHVIRAVTTGPSIVLNGTGMPAASDAEARAMALTTRALTPANGRVLRETVLHDTYTGKANGALPAADTGNTWLAGGAPLTINTGTLRNEQVSPGAGYIDTDLGAKVSRIGAQFIFPTGATSASGDVAMVSWATSVQTAPFPPDSPFHLAISLTGASWGVWENQVYTILDVHVFARALTLNALYEVEATIDGDTVTMRWPDGHISVVPNALIASLGGNFAGFEIMPGSVGVAFRPRFVKVWADTTPEKSYSTAPVGATYRAIGDAVEAAPNTGALPRSATAGQFVMTNAGGWTQELQNNGFAVLQPIDIPDTLTIDRMYCDVATAGSAGSVVRMGIYNDDGSGNGPGTLLLDAGTVATTTTGVKFVAAALTLTRRRYWVTAVSQAAPATQPTLRVSSGPGVSSPLFVLTSLIHAFHLATGITGALPGTLTVGTTIAATWYQCPRVAFRTA